MTRVAVVANPAKLDDPESTRRVVDGVLADHGLEPALWFETTAEDPGCGQTREALEQGADLVCAIGGDGTVRAVGDVLAGGDVPLGLLPAGTGNLLARALDLPLTSLEDALGIALDGRTHRLDVGGLRVDGADEELVFLVMAGMGLDAEAMAHADERLKGAVGWPAYLVSGARAAVRGGFTANVQTRGGQAMTRTVRAVVIGNSGRLQGGVELLPEASLDDGLLDVAVVAPRGLAGWIRTIATVFSSGRSHAHLERRQTTDVRVSARHPTAVQLDGDALGEHRVLTCRVRPGALPVQLPAEQD
ncbi:diacylglycerol/lipid kinase family protein [Cellulomonas timonensis]|uniref:diacylglycerol/lipid kinase family protein n=1 Tax=Cellulomonas timonensis TaxID=1689271 RepID=UPI000834922B|nr:diacylglycerol kinase family protein [Cellulomonas timonensis]